MLEAKRPESHGPILIKGGAKRLIEIKEFVGHKPIDLKEQSEKDQRKTTKKTTKKNTQKNNTVQKKG